MQIYMKIAMVLVGVSFVRVAADMMPVVKHLKIAVATSPGTRAAVTLVKQVAANRGLIIELFDSVEEALSCLRQHQGASKT